MPHSRAISIPGLSLALLLLAAHTPRLLVAQSAGVIQGRVDFEDPAPRRRSASRYPGGRAEASEIQKLPAVAYLAGRVPGASGATTAEMTQRDTTFIPSVVFVAPGGSVAFPNDDPFQHNVYSYSSAKTFDLGRQNPGSSAAVDFPETGIVEVFCEVHDFMRGAVIVTENPYSALVGADGSFRISGVPPGEYTIAFWHAEHEPAQETVSVTAGGTATVQVQMHR
jgi:plastocyanin